MDGQTLCADVRRLLLEGDSSNFVDDKVTLDFLWEAAIQINHDLKLLTDIATITTVDGTSNYDLPADFQELYIVDSFNRYFVKENDGSNDYLLFWKDYGMMYYNGFNNSTLEQAISNNFSIVDSDPATVIKSTATAVGAEVYDECTLTDSTAPFANVKIGDIIHNITDTSDGLVIGITSTSVITVALYDGTNNDWTSGDTYVLVPQGRLALVLDPTPSTSGYTISIPYVKRPNPVYSSYGVYPFPATYRYILTKYAAWLYKYRDKEPNYGDAWYKQYDIEIRRNNRVNNRLKNKSNFKVNFNKTSLGDRSWR